MDIKVIPLKQEILINDLSFPTSKREITYAWFPI